MTLCINRDVAVEFMNGKKVVKKRPEIAKIMRCNNEEQKWHITSAMLLEKTLISSIPGNSNAIAGICCFECAVF